MKKMTSQRLPIYAGLSILLSTGVAHGDSATATNPQSSGAAQPAQVDRAFYPKNPHLVELERRLRDVILAAEPDTKIEFIANFLVAHFRSKRFATHLTDSIGIISVESLEHFPADFSEFQLDLSVDKDVMYYRSDGTPRSQPQAFGTTFSNRYNLRVLADNLQVLADNLQLGGESPDVPREHWAYNEYDKLSKTGLLPDRFPKGFWSGPHVGMMTRYELAVAIARLTDKFRAGAQAANDNPGAKNSLAALQKEFAPELSDLGFHLDTNKPVINGQTWQPRYEYLSFGLTYGKGMNVALVERIKQTIAAYAAASFTASAPESAAPTRK